jgi:autotransporter strand-loop-strand O-heptosyltransferase
MPTSYNYFKDDIKQYLVENLSKNAKILDAGPGIGTYSTLLKDYGFDIDAVEIYEPYVEKYNLRDKYKNVFVQSIVGFDITPYDFVILGDVLEHICTEDAQVLINSIISQNKGCLVAIPYMMEQGEHEGNIHETHLQPDLTLEVMEQRYPNLQLIYGNEYYGYYTNKKQKHEKAYVLYADDSYFDLVESCCRSIRSYSNYPIYVYMLNSDKQVIVKDTITIRWDCDVKNYIKRKDYIDRSDKSIYKLLIERPKITKDALTNYAETIAYIDTDSVASPYVDRIFDFYDYDSTYPYFVEGVYDYLHINGRGGADSRDDLSTTLEHPACDLFGINQYVRERYRQTGYYVAGQKTIDFLDEWYWMCNHPAILNNFQWYAPYHEETIMNVLLYKRLAFNGLPCMYVNGLHDNLEFTGEARIDGHWLRIPAKKEDLLFYHGEKDIAKINAFIYGEKKMRILYLAPHLSTGGMPQFLLKRIEALKDYTDCEIYVVEYQCYSLDFVVQRDKIKSLLGENFTTLYEDKMELFKVIEKWNPHIIHIDEPSERLDMEMVKQLYNPNRKYRIVETCHDVSFNPDSEKIFHPDSYIFCSPYHEETFANMDSNFVTIQYPIDKQEVNAVKNGKNVLNVGLWTKGKNQGEGIEIARKYPEFTFHFVGNQAGNFSDYWLPLMKDLPSNVIVWGERKDINTFMEMADIFMFNSTWECNPLVLREAISYGLPIIARNLPQYGDMFTDYLQPIDSDLNALECNYEVPTDNTTPIFAFRQEDAYKRIIELPIQKQKVSVSQHFVDNPFLEIKSSVDSKFKVQFLDKNGSIDYENVINSNTWVKLNKTYFKNWTAKVWQGDEMIYANNLNLHSKRVFIAIESKSLGDTLAWVPYALEFQKLHQCKVILSTFWNKILDYPELELVEPGNVVNNIYALYRLGWFYDSNKEPEVPNTIPLQKAATNILGLEFTEIRPILKIENNKSKLGGKYVTIATNSTAGCKFWTREGWQELINYLHNKGYGVINVSKENNPFDNCTKISDTSIENTIDVILHSEFFIGLSSGLSWLAWALKKKVIMISNFTAADHEFQLDCIRVTNTSVCNSCWNEEGIIFDKGDWNWCKHKGTEKHFECHKSITAQMVIDKIKTFL